MLPVEVRRLFESLLPIYGQQKLDPLKLEYQLNPKSRAEIELILERLAQKAFGEQQSLAPPQKGQVQGTYQLGKVVVGDQTWDRFGLKEDEWIQHTGIFGRTGSGKTNVGYLILRELAAHKKPFLVFDWKRNYRDLLQRPEFSRLQVYTVGRKVAPFRFNPLIPPPGTDPEIFLKKLIEIMMHVYWLGDGVAYLLQKAIDAVYQHAGNQSPSLFDVREWLGSYKARGREGQWMDSTRRVIETLCFGQIGRVVRGDSNAGFEKILKSQAVLELDALSNADKTFLIEAILGWLHLKRMREPGREQFKHALVIEEAHHVLLKRPTTKETVMDVTLREIRELGEAIIFLDQHPSLVSVPSLGNSYTTIAMNVKHGNDVAALSKAMLLDDDQRTHLGRLPVGEALVKLQGRWVQPFLVRFPHFAVRKGCITDEDLRRQDLGDSGQRPEIRASEQEREELRHLRAGDRDTERARISSEEARLLEDVLAFPTDGVLQRIERLGVSTDRFYALLKSIESSGLASTSSVSTLRGRKRIVMPTPDGAKAVGAEQPTLKKHESPEHWYWKMRVAEEFRGRGAVVEIEKDGADLVVTQNGKKIAVEIETGKSDAEQNVRRNLANGFGQVLVIWIGEKQAISKDSSEVKNLVIQEFLDRR